MNSTSGHRSDIVVTQLLFFLVIYLIFRLMNGLLVPEIANAFGISNLKEFLEGLSENNTSDVRYKLKIISSITHIITFTVPSLVFVYLTFKTKAFQFLQLGRLPKLNEVNMALLMILVAFPIAQLFLQLNHFIPLTDNALEMEDQAQSLTKTLLVMESPTELIATLFIMALIPAIGEELMFRGIIQKYLTQRNIHSGIFISAIIFSAMHMQFEGFLPRVFLGMVLGYLYYWSGSLWLPILAHFINNGFQVLVVYFYTQNGHDINVANGPSLEWYVYFIAIILFSGTVYWFIKNGTTMQREETKDVSHSI